MTCDALRADRDNIFLQRENGRSIPAPRTCRNYMQYQRKCTETFSNRRSKMCLMSLTTSRYGICPRTDSRRHIRSKLSFTYFGTYCMYVRAVYIKL